MTNRIVVDTDSEIGYEKNGFIRKFINVFYIPLLNSIHGNTRNFIKKTNVSAKKVIENATSHQAIEVLYNYGEAQHSRTLSQRFFHHVWFSTNNPKAVRNRLRLVKRELKKSIKEHLAGGRNINILSIASGSARAVLDAVADPFIKGTFVKVTFIDKNEAANEYSKQLASHQNYPSNYDLRWVTDTARNFSKYFDEIDKPNIIEMVGLMDYFESSKVEDIFSAIYVNLAPGGIFISANICDNSERKFVTKVVGWEMIYREPEDFLNFAIKAGFREDDIMIFYEPLRIHFVMVVKKQ
ncbi:MAG: hypothetical protein COW61_03705 [Candidatus Yonathbacteria bacterium CG17_big_fil_post_rev_8_21_14_2_50_46_19]|nr:MAG: hypothetical protein COW61_03705 [Candidatus Yonathbacteria bacterium CG17_big_fil_post_rev_8_21_14_2_50_46_19]